MKLPRLYDFLRQQPRYHESGDGIYCRIACPYCGDSQTDLENGSFSIKIDVNDDEPMLYQCFRASCMQKGMLKAKDLQLMGCMDQDIFNELAEHNNRVKPGTDKKFVVKRSRDYQLVNLATRDNRDKLDYVNRRLGMNWTTPDLRNYKIQLGLYEFLRINNIKHLAYPPQVCDLLDANCIGFMSMYSDYLIFRDCSPEMMTGRRYHMYRASGRPDPDDTKIYCIPGEIDLLSPKSADINVAEGVFSILGSYLHTDLGRDHPNNLWLANCGSGYTNTILRTIKQYGLLHIHLHIWSDSEIKLTKYEKLKTELRGHCKLKSMSIHYNDRAEDFGQPANKIKVRTISLEG